MVFPGEIRSGTVFVVEMGGFGVGARCSLLGYFLRFDYAWGVEDFKIANKKGMFLFSIGTDF